jgi:biopolymer transport protein ExbB
MCPVPALGWNGSVSPRARPGGHERNRFLMRIVVLSLMLMVLIVLAAALPALAQSGEAVPAPRAVEIKYFDFFVVKGGVIGYALILLSIVTIALTVEHALSIRRPTIVPPEAARETRELIEQRMYVEAVRYSGEDPSMLGYVVNAGLLEAANGYVAMERAMEEALDERSAKLFRKTEYLNIIGNVSPMIGLFGTVVGMILLFAEIQASNTFPPARIVADRIAIALITTFWGLGVAIPALSIHAVFRNRIDVLTAECAIAAEHILAIFKPGNEPKAGAAAASRPQAAPV